MDEIQKCDIEEEQGDLSQDLRSKRLDLKEKLRKVLNDEASLWRSRAKQHWLREGEGNTRFFHSVANGRRRVNWIGSTSDNGASHQSEEEKQKHFYRFFKALFTPEESIPNSFGDWATLFRSNRVDSPNLAHLTEPFSVEEIRLAVFQLGSDKAPGPYGFSMKFYQTFWEIVKEDIFNVFEEMFEGRLSSAPFDYAFICLIPKKEGATQPNDFRPISLLNGIQKNPI